jgi:hypothetical protein
MKQTVVPAQITTIEDRISGRLSFQQLMLLAAAIFLDFAIYAALPRAMHLNMYKLALLLVITLTTGLSAVRIKGKILLNWAITIARYNARPRRFVFNKNDGYMRYELLELEEPNEPAEDTASRPTRKIKQSLSDHDRLKLDNLLARSAVRYSIRKGGLRVHISQVE